MEIRKELKKGIFFSVDALIAVTIILSVVGLASVFYMNKPASTQEVYFSSDIVQILSTMKIGEVNYPGVIALINRTNVTELNRTILEQALRFQVAGNENEAQELLNLTIGNLVPDYYNIGIWIEGYSDPIYEVSNKTAEQLISSKQMVSGIEKDKVVEGLASRAFLSGINERSSAAYAYFGGYEGDGNITKKLILPSTIKSIDSAYMDLDAGGEFDLYINDILSGHYIPSQGLRADEWQINSTYLSNFNAGENTIKFYFNGSNKFIGGGYFRVGYSSSELVLYEGTGLEKAYLPGVEGLINIYSSFYVPGSLNKMDIHLNGESEYEVYLSVAGQIVYNYNLSGTVDIPDSELRLSLDYDYLSNKTIPLRIGIISPNITEATGSGIGNVDVVLITDLSGSMNNRMDSDVTGVERGCSDPMLYDSSTKRISVAKCLDKEFIDSILGDPQNRVALSAFYGDSKSPYKGRVYEESLTNDASYLKGRVDLYSPQGGTCICCAINDAYEILDAQSDASKEKFVIVMSDGIPTHTCQAASGCTGTRTGLPSREGLWLGSGSGCYGGIDDCSVGDCDCASENAEWSSCRVYNTHNATVYSIGFGPVGSCTMANQTLRDIAACGNGEYFSSDNATILSGVYDSIAESILNISFEKQTAVIIGNLSSVVLYPDSYIEFNYTPTRPAYEYGRIPVIVESARLGNNITEGALYIPNDVLVYDAKVTSYSSDRWTDTGMIKNSGNWTTFFQLSDYGVDYNLLGDPYIINIPINLIQQGNNTVRVSTGVNPANTTGGSPDNRIIFTGGIDIDINYTGVFDKAEGCNWDVMFEDGTSNTIAIPSDYSGSKNCNFDENTDCDNDYDDDAIDNAICHLFTQMDFDNDGLLFIKFGQNDLDIETVSIGKIPFMWGPTMVDVRVWR